jgi:ABC-type multidrug transport system fused ATPase/permease subunit
MSVSASSNISVLRTLQGTLRGYVRKLATLSVASIVTAFSEVCVLAVLLAAIESIAGGGKPYVLANPLDGMAVDVATPHLLLACLCLTLARTTAQVTLAYAMARLATGFEADQRRRLLASFLQASWDCQSRERSGYLIVLMTRNIEAASRAISNLGMATSSGVSFTVLVGSAFYFDWRCAVAVLTVSGTIFLAMRPLSEWARVHARRKVEVHSAFVNLIGQGTGLAKEFRTFGIADYFSRVVGQLIGNIRRFRSGQIFLTNLIPTVHQNISVLIVLGGLTTVYLLNYGNLGSLSLVVLLLLRAMTYGQHLQIFHHAITEGTAYIEELQVAEAEYRRNALREGGAEIQQIDSLAMEQVSFQYEADDAVLQDVSFRIERGEMIGIIGPSGSGKTTLMQLLLRLREPQQGRYLVNGRLVDDFSFGSWFEHVAFVPQEAMMLNESLAECIRFHRDEIDDSRVRTAARQAGIYDEIVAFPQGFDTLAGERGSSLSGGQRQRICIARALAGNPDVIVFDEPTSALDVHSEAVILDTLVKLKGRITTFIIAHRLSTLNMCDRVMVLRNGIVQSFDAPKALAEHDAYYNEALRLAQVH